jgi:hypothetical protein
MGEKEGGRKEGRKEGRKYKCCQGCRKFGNSCIVSEILKGSNACENQSEILLKF